MHDVDGMEVRRRYEADPGESLYQIARSMGRQYRDVKAAFEAAGGQIKPLEAWPNRRSARQGKLSPEDRRDVVARFLAGETIKGLAGAFEVGRPTIRYHLRKAGVLQE